MKVLTTAFKSKLQTMVALSFSRYYELTNVAAFYPKGNLFHFTICLGPRCPFPRYFLFLRNEIIQKTVKNLTDILLLAKGMFLQILWGWLCAFSWSGHVHFCNWSLLLVIYTHCDHLCSFPVIFTKTDSKI